jgi:7-keto-8-aminopelargonate synthetase-like enzyme
MPLRGSVNESPSMSTRSPKPSAVTMKRVAAKTSLWGAASRKAIEIAASLEGDSLRAKLWLNLQHLHSLLPINAPASAILLVLIGNESAAVETSARLLEKGFLVPAIRFPTVAKGSARLRVTLTAAHTASGIDSLAEALQACTG